MARCPIGKGGGAAGTGTQATTPPSGPGDTSPRSAWRGEPSGPICARSFTTRRRPPPAPRRPDVRSEHRRGRPSMPDHQLSLTEAWFWRWGQAPSSSRPWRPVTGATESSSPPPSRGWSWGRARPVAAGPLRLHPQPGPGPTAAGRPAGDPGSGRSPTSRCPSYPASRKRREPQKPTDGPGGHPSSFPARRRTARTGGPPRSGGGG